MLVTAPDRKHLQLAASHKPFCKASRRAECGKSACSVRRGGGWKPTYGSVSEKLPEETGMSPQIGPTEYGAISPPYHRQILTCPSICSFTISTRRSSRSS